MDWFGLEGTPKTVQGHLQGEPTASPHPPCPLLPRDDQPQGFPALGDLGRAVSPKSRDVSKEPQVLGTLPLEMSFVIGLINAKPDLSFGVFIIFFFFLHFINVHFFFG